MAQTVQTSATSYATATNLINSHNANDIGDWCSKTGIRVTPVDILTDTVVAAALLRASGEVEAYCQKGKRYKPVDLNALTGASQALLVGLVCDLAMYHLGKRFVPDPEKIAGAKEAKETLKAIGEGELIFGFVETANAGNMSTVDIQYDSSDRIQRPTEMASRLFGRRMDTWDQKQPES